MLTRRGNTVEHGDTIYQFDNEEDAKGFEACIRNGGMPGTCASQWRCRNKLRATRERDSGPEL